MNRNKLVISSKDVQLTQQGKIKVIFKLDAEAPFMDTQGNCRKEYVLQINHIEQTVEKKVRQ